MSLIAFAIATAGIASRLDGGTPSNKILMETRTKPSIPYSYMHTIEPGDSPEVIEEKAAKVLPRPNQVDWMRLERTFFIHFGPNAFRGVEWGTGQEDPAIFNPTAFDAEQWLETIKDGDGKMLILVCKHHDGLCLWQTRYTNHSVAASPWRGGKGDVVKDVARAAKKRGIRLGVYLSPADLYQLRTNPKNPQGYYGNGSRKVRSVIPTDPAAFQTDPTKRRADAKSPKTFEYTVNDYNRYFLNQLYELLTEYGPITDVWFDGANPDPSVNETYDYAAWYDLIRKLAPKAVISIKAPDVRWVGNEGGWGREMEWSVIPLPAKPDVHTWPDMYGDDLGSRSKLKPGSHLWWYPAETNVPILYGWFWAKGKYERPASDIVNLYYQAVGRNSNWLLNLSPDTRGLIPDGQAAPLRLASQVIRETFAKDLAKGGTLTADSSGRGHAAASAVDGNPNTWWEAATGKRTASLSLEVPHPVTFDVISLQEAVVKRGQRIEAFEVEAEVGGSWKKLDSQTTVGYKRLLRIASPVTTSRVRVRIVSSRMEPTLASIGLYKQADLLQPPAILDRTLDGTVEIQTRDGMKVVYTTDGSVPNLASPAYSGKFALPEGGTVTAALIGKDGRIGMTGAKVFPGYARKGWSLLFSAGHGASEPGSVIDGVGSTFVEVKSPMPASLTVDMGRALAIGGISYLPRQDGAKDGIVDEYMVEVSLDGLTWTTRVERGRFWNIKNNPVLQQAEFEPIQARFVRFTSLKEVDGKDSFSIADFGVLPPGKQ